MIFQPKHYPTMEDLRADMIWCTNGAHSSESVNNVDIFGYFNDQPYYALLTSREFDQIDFYWIAGEVIPAHWM